LILVKGFGIKPRRRPVAAERKAYRPKPIRPIVAPWVRTPLVDVYIESDRVLIMAYMPGVEERDIEVEASEWEVIIAAERGNVRFYRHLVLPVPVIPKIERLTYRNGVLSFMLRRLTSNI